MTISIAGLGEGSVQGGSSLTVNFDTAPQAGDLILVVTGADNQGLNTPAGWTQIFTSPTGGFTYPSQAFYRIAGAGEPSNVVFQPTNGGTSHFFNAAALILRNATGFGTHAVTSVGGVSGALASPGTAITERNGLLVAGFTSLSNAINGLSNPSGGWTLRKKIVNVNRGAEVWTRNTAPTVGENTAASFNSNVNTNAVLSQFFIKGNAAPTAPGAFTSPTVGQSVNTTVAATHGAATDPESDALQYELQITTNNGGSWAALSGLLSATTRVVDLTAQPPTTAARIRSRAYDGIAYGPWTESATFTIQHNAAGNAPTPTSPINNSVIDRNTTQRFNWTRNDPDVGDSQSKYDWRYRLVGAPSWTEVLGVVSTNLYRDVAAGTFTAGAYEWQVRTYDSQGAPDVAWSASAYFTAAEAPAAPTITYPVNNGGIVTELDAVSWSTPTQDGYEVRKVADAAGAPNTGTVYYTSGQVVSAGAVTARNAPLSFPVNNRFEHIQVRIRNNGLWSSWSSVRVSVAYTPPPAPIVDTVSDPATGSILVLMVNPAPVGTQPAVASNEVWIDDDDGSGLTRRAVAVPVNGTWRYWTPPSEKSLTIRVNAMGANGTSSMSA